MKELRYCGGVPSVPTMFPASTVMWPIIPHTCIYSPAATALLHHWIHIGHQTHTGPEKGSGWGLGPLPPSRSHTYLFTIINRTSRWLEAIPLASITAADCARALFAGWVSRFGVPATITSDRWAKFTSALWAGLCSLLNIQHSPMTAYHPQSNGLVKRFHRRLKDALQSRHRLARPPPLGDAGHQSLLQRRQRIFTGEGGVRLTADSARTFYQHRRVAITVFPQWSADHDNWPPATADAAQLSPSSIHTTRGAAAGTLRPGPPGQCTAAAVAHLRRPYRVLERSTHFFILEMGDRTDKVSTLRLKAAWTPADTELAKPPRRGRPVA